MVLGTFWCQRDKLWVRFIEENKVVQAWVAKNSDNSSVTTEWQQVNEGCWPVNYEAKSKEPLKELYSLKKGVLYKSDGSVNKYSGLLIFSERRDAKWYPTKSYSLPEYIGKDFEISSYDNLPLTPEMFAEKQKFEQEAQLKKIQVPKTWEELQNSDLHRIGMEKAYSYSFFNKQLEGLFLDSLNGNLYQLNPRKFSVIAYLHELKNIIEDNSNPWHEKIIELAARTDLDNQLCCNLPTKELFEAKKTVYFNALREEANDLAKKFNINCTILDDETLAKQQAEKKRNKFNFEEKQEIPFHEYWGFDYSGQQEEHFQDNFGDQNQHQPNEEIDLQKAIASSLKSAPIFFDTGNDLEFEQIMRESANEYDMLDSIKKAVSKAQEKYKNWYGGAELRGPNGNFTFWFRRHGEYGQTRAVNFNNEIATMTEQYLAISEVNNLLRSDSTNYNRHSFASFLLDELIKIPDSPWDGIKYMPQSNLYDKEKVRSHLDSFSVNVISNIM